MRPTSVVVDDHDSFRRMARQLLEAAGCVVVGEACDVVTAVDVVRAVRPMMVLLDVLLPDGTAVDVVSQLSEFPPLPRILLTSSRGLDEHATELDGFSFMEKSELTVERIRNWAHAQ